MAKTEKPPIIVYGDYYEIHNNTFYGGGLALGNKAKHQQQQPQTRYSDDDLRERIDQVMPMVGGTISYLFPVIKVLMWMQLVPDHCFDKGVALLNRLYPELNISKQQEYAISKYDVDSFYFGFEQWKCEDAPVKGRSFKIYSNIAKTLLSQF